MAKKKPKLFPGKGGLLTQTTLSALVILLVYAFFEYTQPTNKNLPAPGPSTTKTPATTTLPPSDHPLDLYSNQTGDDLTQLYGTAIKEAQKSITFVIYALTDPQIIRALKDKSDEGVEVYIVSDAKASPGLTRKIPNAKVVRRVLDKQGLTHQKILIVDDRLVVLGSSNMTPSSLKNHGNLVVALENPALAQSLSAKVRSMDEDGGSIPLLHQRTKAVDQHVELWVLPDDQKADERIRELIRSAKKSIKVAMFTWTRNDFTQDLIEAANRGVRVEAVVDRYTGKGASAKIVRLLEQSGIPIRLSTSKGLMHHKFMLIDNEILVNGSANWTYNAFKNNDDVFLVIYPLKESQRRKMDQLWKILLRQSQPAD